MTTPLLPPKTEPLVDKKDSFATLNWLVFFDQVATGDSGTTWTPTFTGLTETGTAVKTGVYYRISAKLVYFRIVITPATNTSAALGTTYCNNFPLRMISNGSITSLSGFTAVLSGATSSDNRIYTGTWSAITNPVTIVGILEAN